MYRPFSLAVLMLFFFSGAAFAAERTITVAHDATWPPMEFIDSNKKIVGYAPDYIDAIGKSQGVKIVHKNVAWDGIFAGLAAGKYDVIASSVTITDERKKGMDFSEPYCEILQAVVTPKTLDVKKVEDLKGKTLGAQMGTTGFFAIQRMQNVTAKSYDDIGMAMEALFNGRIDAVVCDDPVAADFALQRKEYAEKLRISFVITDAPKEYYGFAVKKGNKEVLDILNKGIEAAKKDGSEAALLKKWLGK